MRVIITGGTGLIGRALSADLTADGHEVIVLSRTPGRSKGLPAGVRVEPWDGRTGDGWAILADGADAILAAMESTNRKEGIRKPIKDFIEKREGYQLSFFQLDDPILSQVRDEILNLDVNNLTPMDALNKLNEIKKIVKGK